MSDEIKLLKRPSKNDNFDDILQQHQQYINSGVKPSATVISKKSVDNRRKERSVNAELPKKESLFKQRSNKLKSGEKFEVSNQNLVLKDVVKENVVAMENIKDVNFSSNEILTKGGFPPTFHRSDESNVLFSKKILKNDEELKHGNFSSFRNFQGTELEREIHDENFKLFTKLSPKEIEEERHLDQSLDDGAQGKKKKILDNNKIFKSKPVSLEEKKLEWINTPSSLEAPSIKDQPKVAEFRFDFKGLILKEGCDSFDNSLYHHGDQQQNPGYTIQEALYFTRSKLDGQRLIGLKILGEILYNLRETDLYKGDGVDIEYWLYQLNFLVYIRWSRSALVDSNMQVVRLALQILHVFFNVQQSEVFGNLFDTKLGLKRFCLSVESVKGFRNQSLGLVIQKVEDNDVVSVNDNSTMEAVVKLMREDIFKGLLKMNVLDQMTYFLEKNIERTICFELLTIFSMHSVEVSDTLITNGFLKIFLEILAVNWPLEKPTEASLIFLKQLMHSSRKNCDAVLKAGLVDCIMRFVTKPLPEDDQIYIWRLRKQCFCCLRVLWSFKLGIRIFDEYATLIFESFILNKTEKNLIVYMSPWIRMVLSLINFEDFQFEFHFKYIFNEIIKFFQSDTFLHCTESIGQNDLGFYELCSSIVEFLTNFIVNLNKNEKSKITFYINSIAKLKLHQSTFFKSTLNLLTIESTSEKNEKGAYYRYPSFLENSIIGLGNFKAIANATILLNLTCKCNFVSSIIDAFRSFSIIDDTSEWSEILHLTLTSDTVICLLNRGVEKGYWGFHYGIERSNFLRFFGYGWNEFQRIWLEAVGATTPVHAIYDFEPVPLLPYMKTVLLNKSQLSNLAPLIFKVGLNLLTDLLPGDEVVGLKVLNTLIFGESWMKMTLGLDQTEDRRTWKSECFYQLKTCNNLIDFTWDLSKVGKITFPLPLNWIFSPIKVVADQMKLYSNAENGDDSDVKDIDLVLLNLRVLYCIETKIDEGYEGNGKKFCRYPFLKISDEPQLFGLGNKILNIFELFLSGEKVFLDKQFITLTKSLLVMYFKRVIIDDKTSLEIFGRKFSLLMEQSVGGQMKFFKFYKEALEIYASESYCDETFTKLILLPIQMGFSSDYRELFFNSLVDSFKTVKNFEPFHFGDKNGLKPYFFPTESHFGTLTLMLKCLIEIEPLFGLGNSFLQNFCSYHLSSFLFRDLHTMVKGASKNLFQKVSKINFFDERRKLLLGLKAVEKVFEKILWFDFAHCFENLVNGADEFCTTNENYNARKNFCEIILLEKI
ncbi:hypothetical protein HK099_000797 [Clydaea vesicula]|uniref:RNA polymerase II-associated protein 1 n=1 Tax=Clydaea vesicula TaxID=447962 RepID=A0AAD5U7P6_9FUNG|nr:hypothetical protein HK099_000797 [Clydaea vesicula]